MYQITEDEKLAYDLRQEGMTFRDIAKRLNTSLSQAHRRCGSAQRKIDLNTEGDVYSGLGHVAISRLHNAGLKTREDIRHQIESGKRLKGVGEVTRKEIIDWLEGNKKGFEEISSNP